MRIVCLVPSLTETLIEAGLNVVGRTRFCVHPEEQVKDIAVVGGTKDLDWRKINELQPDLLVLDREENLPWMKSEAPCEVLVSHITSIKEMCVFSDALALRFAQNVWLRDFAQRWHAIQNKENRTWDWNNIPGVLQSWVDVQKTPKQIHYIIWRKPWMGVGRETFIGSVFEKLGAADLFSSQKHSEKYPTLLDEDLTGSGTVAIFSSEPFPFHKFVSEISKIAPNGALVEGEFYSWFGIRSLRCLEKAMGC